MLSLSFCQMQYSIQISQSFPAYYILINLDLKDTIITLAETMQALRQKKQQYLRQKIIDDNYDPNEFMDYCESSIGSVDIDQWSLEQLTRIVDDFISSKHQPIVQKVSSTQQSNSHVGLDEFDDWVNTLPTQPVPAKKEQAKFELNLFDLDFLEGMGMPSTTKPAPINNANIFAPPPAKVETKQQSNQGNSNFMSVPTDVAKRLQQGNDSFIVGFKPAVIPIVQPSNTKPISQPQPKLQVHRNQSPNRTQNKTANQGYPSYNSTSGNNLPPPSSVSPPPFSHSYDPQSNPLSVSQTNSESFNKKIVCKKLINKSRLQGNEDVVISGHQIINPNVFVPKYVLYFVTVNPNNVEVKRRLKDFESLRDLLIKFFPTTQIPHLQRCSRLSETEPATIKKQILFLESFLNSLLMKKQLKCKLLEQFLLCKDLDLLKKIFKQYEKLSGPRSLQGLFSPSGELQLKMSGENRRYVNQNIGLNEFMRQHFSKIKGLYDTLIQGFEKNTSTLNEIQQLHKIFKQKIKSVNKQFTPEYQCPQLQKSIQRVEMMHKQWAASFKTQVRIIQSELRHLYRYEQDNIETLRQQLKLEQQISSAFAKRTDKDQANRDAYQSRKLEQFKISLASPSKNITVLKHQAAYMQQKLSQQCLGYLSELSLKLDHRFKLFCTLQFSICHDMESVWKNFQHYYK